MAQEINDNEEPQSGKPTITIAEKDGGETASDLADKPTITIAEKDGGN